MSASSGKSPYILALHELKHKFWDIQTSCEWLEDVHSGIHIALQGKYIKFYGADTMVTFKRGTVGWVESNASANLFDDAIVVAKDAGEIIARDRAQVVAAGHTKVHAYDDVLVIAGSGNSEIFVHGPNVRVITSDLTWKGKVTFL